MSPPRQETPQVELDDVLTTSRFHERHRRCVDLPIAQVWPAALAVTSREVRSLGPFLAIRGLPARLTRSAGRATAPREAPSMLEEFIGQGFLAARCDEEARARRALVLVCAVGRFWSPIRDELVHLEDLEAFRACDEPGMAKLAATLEAVDRGDHTELITETRVVGTDDAANRAFAAYWAVIRLPSGLIRRSWLAAIARRAVTSTPA